MLLIILSFLDPAIKSRDDEVWVSRDDEVWVLRDGEVWVLRDGEVWVLRNDGASAGRRYFTDVLSILFHD